MTLPTIRTRVVSRTGKDDNGQSTYQVVTQYPTMTTVTLSDLPWSDILTYNGKNKTMLVVGNGPNNISQEEKDAITAGTRTEVVWSWTVAPNLDNIGRLNNLHDKTRAAIAANNATLQDDLGFFGIVEDYDS